MQTKNRIGVAGCMAGIALMMGGNAYGTSVMYSLAGPPKAATNRSFLLGEFMADDYGSVGYALDVAPGVSVNSFAVSLVAPPGGFTLEMPSGWTHVSVAKANWATGRYGFANVLGSSLGSFESLFGTTDDMAIVFTAPTMISTGPPTMIPGPMGPMFIPGVTTFTPGFLTEADDSDSNTWLAGLNEPSVPFIRFGGSPSTEVIALDSNGSLIGATMIPEPSTALLALLGCAGLLRRKR